MVLNRTSDNPALRYLFGIFIIAVSIYVYYTLTALRGSPGLFLIPDPTDPKVEACTSYATGRFSACIPIDIDCSPRYGRLEIYSAKNRIRGSIEVLDKLPQEKEWRNTLHNRFIKAFIGDERKMRTYELMNTILSHRFNPTLMGAKAALIPPWMKNAAGARILTLRGDKGLVFYTPMQCVGISFRRGAILILSIKGHVTADDVTAIIHSIKITSPEGQGMGSRGAS
jgi:hypothetical protein